MKITYVEVSHQRDGKYNFTTLFVHRGKEITSYFGHSKHFFDRAYLLLKLFYEREK